MQPVQYLLIAEEQLMARKFSSDFSNYKNNDTILNNFVNWMSGQIHSICTQSYSLKVTRQSELIQLQFQPLATLQAVYCNYQVKSGTVWLKTCLT
jgi:hypothetical protein